MPSDPSSSDGADLVMADGRLLAHLKAVCEGAVSEGATESLSSLRESIELGGISWHDLSQDLQGHVREAMRMPEPPSAAPSAVLALPPAAGPSIAPVDFAPPVYPLSPSAVAISRPDSPSTEIVKSESHVSLEGEVDDALRQLE